MAIQSTIKHIPTSGPHFLKNIDVGNIYDRTPFFDYISPPVQLPGTTKRLTLTWKGETPRKTEIRFECRTADDERALETAKWIAVTPGKDFSLTRRSNFVLN